jgi:hypothetical protein
MTIASPIFNVACTTVPSGLDRRDSSTAPKVVLQKSISDAASRHTNIGITLRTASGILSDMPVLFFWLTMNLSAANGSALKPRRKPRVRWSKGWALSSSSAARTTSASVFVLSFHRLPLSLFCGGQFADWNQPGDRIHKSRVVHNQ